ncbi:MAG TPA: hypothetical protein VEI03_03770 [Stellaceae bacterium]|nr:hypothetical protein [Stellaceae bacterium]
MTKLERRTRFDRYEALLARHGDRELLDTFEALMRALAEKLRSRPARRARPDAGGRRQSATPPARPAAAVPSRRS